MLRLRQLWLNVHLWLGVGLFVVLVPLGLTGSILVWDQDIERALNAERYQVSDSRPILSPSEYIIAAENAFAGQAQVASIRLPAEPGVPVTVVGQIPGPPGPNGRPRQLTAWLDPQTARVTDTAEVARSGFSVIHRLHGSLLIPDIGRKVVGWLGWAMALSSVTGLILWWPRNGNILKGLRWTRTPMAFDNLHHMVGFWVCVPLAVLSLTGVYIAFPKTARMLFNQPQQSAPQRPRGPSPGLIEETALTVDEAAAAARAGRPAPVTSIAYPAAGKAPAWRVEVGGQTVRVMDGSGEVKADRGAAERTDRATAKTDLSRLMRRLHDGADAGVIWQVVIVMAGIAPTLLGLTGLIMWLRKEARKRALRAS